MVRRKHPQDVVGWRRTGAEYLSLSDTLSQAVQALEMASELAVSRGSSEDLTGAAHGWMRMSETIHGINSTFAAQEPQRPVQSFGFRAPETHEIATEGEPVMEEEDVD